MSDVVLSSLGQIAKWRETKEEEEEKNMERLAALLSKLFGVLFLPRNRNEQRLWRKSKGISLPRSDLPALSQISQTPRRVLIYDRLSTFPRRAPYRIQISKNLYRNCACEGIIPVDPDIGRRKNHMYVVSRQIYREKLILEKM